MLKVDKYSHLKRGYPVMGIPWIPHVLFQTNGAASSLVRFMLGLYLKNKLDNTQKNLNVFRQDWLSRIYGRTYGLSAMSGASLF